MNDFDKLVNALYEFVLFELSKKEQDYKYLVSAYYHNPSMQNSFAVVKAWIEWESYKEMFRRLIEYIRYFT